MSVCLWYMYKLYQRSMGSYNMNITSLDKKKNVRKGVCGHAPSGHRVQIIELFENTACDCYFYLRYHNTT